MGRELEFVAPSPDPLPQGRGLSTLPAYLLNVGWFILLRTIKNRIGSVGFERQRPGQTILLKVGDWRLESRQNPQAGKPALRFFG